MGTGSVFICLSLLSLLLSPRALHTLSLSHAVFTAPLGKTEVEKCEKAEIAVTTSGGTLHRSGLICTFAGDSPCWTVISPRLKFPSLISASALHAAYSDCVLHVHVSQCLSAFSGLGFCRYLYPTHLELATHPLTYESPYFTQSCSPPTYQSRVSAVISCVCIYLCSPHPVPKSRIRVQSGWETRSPPGFSSSSCYRTDSLPDYNSFFCILPWGMKWMIGLEAQLFCWLFPDFLTLEALWGHFWAFYLSFLPVCGLTDLHITTTWHQYLPKGKKSDAKEVMWWSLKHLIIVSIRFL